MLFRKADIDVKPGAIREYLITDGTVSLNCTFLNRTSEVIKVVDCWVVKISCFNTAFRSSNPTAEMVLPGSIRIGSTEEELVALFGDVLEPHYSGASTLIRSTFQLTMSAINVWSIGFAKGSWMVPLAALYSANRSAKWTTASAPG